MNKWVVEWSENQQCFHVDTLIVSLENNRRNFLLGNSTDYIPVAICSTSEDASNIADKLKEERFK